MLMLQSIQPAINLKKNNRKNTTLQVFSILFTRRVAPSGIYGTLLLLLMLLTTTAKKKRLFLGIHIYSHGIAGLTEQQTAFTRAQSMILQNRDFNLCIECMLKIPYPLG